MKLYSRGQLAFFSVASALIVLLLAVGFGLVDGAASGEEAVGAEQTDVEFEFQQSPEPTTPIVAVARTDRLTEGERETIRVFELRNDGVVNISTQRLTLNWFFEAVPEQGQSGSGSIIDKRGYVLTNNHVVEGAADVNVTLTDGTTLSGEVVGTDVENDLAVLKIDPDGRDLSTIPLGTSEGLLVGQNVLAIGNPFAIGRTLTTGVISGLGRSVRNQDNFIINGLIQTDASINPGNSGGPLLNSGGEMIGINTMIYSQSGGSIGIGFAVPVDTARRVVPDLIEFGTVRRGWIEFIPVQVFPQLVRYAGLDVDEGLLVSQVNPGGNAEAAGIRGGNTRRPPIQSRGSTIYLGGDVIVEVDGTPVATLSNLFEALEDTRPGESVRVVYVRNGRRRETDVTLVERPSRLRLE
ncbi:MAG: S1C family serine protease [Spirochaetota bacterium]